VVWGGLEGAGPFWVHEISSLGQGGCEVEENVGKMNGESWDGAVCSGMAWDYPQYAIASSSSGSELVDRSGI